MSDTPNVVPFQKKAEPEKEHPVPTWVTCWPEWFGIAGNVVVVPLSDYATLKNELAAAQAELAALHSERARPQKEEGNG